MLKEEENCKEGQLPEGTCPPQLLERYITMTNFLLEPRSHLYVLPYALQFCKLIMVRYCEVDNSTPIFRLYHKATRHHLLSSKKQGNSIGCNYIISRSSIPQKDSSYVGKLRGNFVGNEFMVYDNGDSSSSSSKCRKQLGLIKISSKTLWGNAEEG